MFKRLVLDSSVTVVTITAFVTAASIYVAFAWRAIRMKGPQLARFENLPFATATPAAQTASSAATKAGQDHTRPISA